MKERITYIHGSGEAFEPDQLQIKEGSLEVTALKAARDHHLTFGLNELPQELRLVLEQFDEFHLRWASTEQIESANPFGSRMSPGLHIFSTRKQGSQSDSLCSMLHKIFGQLTKCQSLNDSFTSRLSISRQNPGSTMQEYHQNLEDLHGLAAYIQKRLCSSGSDACEPHLERLKRADNLDFDYTSSTNNVVLRVHHNHPIDLSTGWTIKDASTPKLRTEVGVLAAQDASERDQIKMGGYLAVLGEDKKMKPTVFQFPSRHHVFPPTTSTYNVQFTKPSGLHPTMRIDIVNSVVPQAANSDSCSLYTYLTLPSTIFPDKYQLSNELLLKSLNIRKVNAISGFTDLEAPDYAVSAWGSNMLIELARPNKADGDRGQWHAEIPLHLRYLPPSNASSGTSTTEIPWPVVFWACEADKSIGRLSGNPFDRIHLGYDAYFPQKTIFYHLQSGNEQGGMTSTLHVPVLNTSLLGKDARLLDLGTGLVVLIGWLWIIWLLFRGRWIAKPSIKTQKKDI